MDLLLRRTGGAGHPVEALFRGSRPCGAVGGRVCAVEAGIPIPVFSSSLAYYDGLRSKRLPTALTQSQRDFFGAHTYGRVDKPGVFHTLWAEEGKPEIEA